MSESQDNPTRTRTNPTTLQTIRKGINRLFSGQSRVGTARTTSEEVPESPKTPRLALGLHDLPSTRLHIPYLNRTRSNGSQDSRPSSQRSQRTLTPTRSRPILPTAVMQQTQQQSPPPSRAPNRPRRSSSTRRFVGVDPAELQLAELAASGRRRRRVSKRIRCMPQIKNRKIRAKVLSCFISGIFLTLILTIYLALALSNRNESQEFHVLLILIILITTIFFCHSLIRLCMMIIRPPADEDTLPEMDGPSGFANPVVPIRVALARDEEAAGIESNATKIPPPAYGLWRESVRVDPNRIFWQRNEAAALERQISRNGSDSRPATARRPPSYISEDGVDYVIEAAPRSIAPTTDVPLPVHPSERGRVATLPGR